MMSFVDMPVAKVTIEKHASLFIVVMFYGLQKHFS